VRRIAALLLALAACGGDGEQPDVARQAAAASSERPLWFVDIAAEAGLSEPTWCGRPEKPHLLESNGTGLALRDLTGDGVLDLYLVNGWRLEGSTVVERGRNRLYRGRGDGSFEDVSAGSGADDDGWGCGVEAGDVDGDGDEDLFVTNFGPDLLLLNRGDGTFERAPQSPGIDGWSAGSVLFDADGDRDLDLFVSGYIDCTLDEVLNAKPELVWRDMQVMLGPFGLDGLANRYFENEGGGRFREATDEAGLTDVGLFFSFNAIALDLDDDLDIDLYVANDSNPNYLYRNDGRGHFEEVGLWSGAALDQGGQAQAGMGLASGDVDRDGRPDLLVTNFANDSATLYINRGELSFVDSTRRWGLKEPTFLPLKWGTTLSDFDLDGWLDIYIANGHIYPQADQVEGSGGFRQKNLLLRGQEGRFVDVSAQAGPGLAVLGVSHALGVGDIDSDGDLDLAVSNIDQPPTLLRNDSPRRGAWLLVDAPTALRAEVRAGGQRWVEHAYAGGGFQSASDPRLHFGLGPVSKVDELVVVWPDGERTVLTDVAVDRVVPVRR